MDLNGQLVSVSGGDPNEWAWANQEPPDGDAARLSIETSGLYTLTTLMREDGFRLDRLLLTTDTTTIPAGEGPVESERQAVVASISLTTTSRVIVYTYDHLYRLTAADYSTGEAFAYAYDPLGNQTALTETLSLTSTVVMTYTYDAANRLVTARADDDSMTWHYTYDDNGNLLRQTPGGTNPAEGETRYSYDAANRLVQVELFTGGSYTLLSEAEYNGVGERVALTTWAMGISQTVSYVVAGGELLVADKGSEETLYLYGQTLIAEYDGEWHYPLRDSNSSVRQTVDENGTVTSGQTYKPFGEILQEGGPYQSAFGFLGAQLDRVSGLLYVGGRYYDPVTGRYLTPNHGQANPYTPIQGPGFWLLLPLIGIVVAWKGRKSGAGRMFVLICVMGTGVLLAGCGEVPPGPTPTQPPGTPTNTPIPPTLPSPQPTTPNIPTSSPSPTLPSTPTPSPTLPPTPCPPTDTPTSTPTPTPQWPKPNCSGSICIDPATDTEQEMVAHVLLQEGGTTLGLQGMLNIAQVIRNRVNSSSFPNDAVGVVSDGNGGQFNAWRAPSIRDGSTQWNNAMSLADMLLTGEGTFATSSGISENTLYFQSCDITQVPLDTNIKPVHEDTGGGRIQYYYDSAPSFGCIVPTPTN